MRVTDPFLSSSQRYNGSLDDEVMEKDLLILVVCIE